MSLLKYHRSRASRLYGDNPTDWDKKKYLKRLKDQRNVRQRAMQRVGAMQTAPCGMDHYAACRRVTYGDREP